MSETRTQLYKQIGLEDVDTAIFNWFDKKVNCHVQTAGNERSKVQVNLATKERWLTGKDTKGIRDQKGRLILPIISIRRTGFNPVNATTTLAVNTPRLNISRKVSDKTSLLQNAISDRPISLRNLNQSTVYEITSIPFPSNGLVSYELVIQAQYQLQMNSIIEKIMSQLEYFETPQFVAMLEPERNEGVGNKRTTELEESSESPYENRKMLDSYYFVGIFDPGMNDGSNFDEFTDQERIVKYTTSFTVPAYLHLDPEGKSPAVKVQKTSFKVKFGEENTGFFDDPYDLELLFKNGKVNEP